MAENSLRRLRRAAGFSSAKAFAEYVGIPTPTYTRYEQGEDGPDTSMPMKNAWLIADKLGCTIDALVGRSEVPESDVRNDMQLFYNRLSDEGKARMEEFCDYLTFAEDRAADRRRQREEAEYIKIAAGFERLLAEARAANPEKADAIIFSSPLQLRALFENFVVQRGADRLAEDERKERSAIEREVRAEYGCISVDKYGVESLVEAPDQETEGAILAEIESDLAAWRDKRTADDEEVIKKIMKAYDKLHPDIAYEDNSRFSYHFVTMPDY